MKTKKWSTRRKSIIFLGVLVCAFILFMFFHLNFSMLSLVRESEKDQLRVEMRGVQGALEQRTLFLKSYTYFFGDNKELTSYISGQGYTLTPDQLFIDDEMSVNGLSFVALLNSRGGPAYEKYGVLTPSSGSYLQQSFAQGEMPDELFEGLTQAYQLMQSDGNGNYGGYYFASGKWHVFNLSPLYQGETAVGAIAAGFTLDDSQLKTLGQNLSVGRTEKDFETSKNYFYFAPSATISSYAEPFAQDGLVCFSIEGTGLLYSQGLNVVTFTLISFIVLSIMVFGTMLLSTDKTILRQLDKLTKDINAVKWGDIGTRVISSNYRSHELKVVALAANQMIMRLDRSRIEAEEALVEIMETGEKLEIYTAMLNVISSGVMIISENGEVEFINNAFEEIAKNIGAKAPLAGSSAANALTPLGIDLGEIISARMGSGIWRGEVTGSDLTGRAFAHAVGITKVASRHDDVSGYYVTVDKIDQGSAYPKRLHEMSITEAVTGLYNESFFIDSLEGRGGAGFVYSITVKEYVDLALSLGAVLTQEAELAIAKKLSRTLEGGDSILAYAGAGEFLYCNNAAGKEEAYDAAISVHGAFYEPLVLDKISIMPRFAVGIAFYSAQISADEAISAARKAAKAALDLDGPATGFYDDIKAQEEKNADKA